MKPTPSPPTLLQGILAAALLSLASGAAFAGFAHLLDPSTAARLVIPAAAGAYMLWLIARSGVRIGRVIAFAGWLATTLALWFSSLELGPYVLTHIALIWLVRSLYFHSSILTSLLDLALVALGVGAAVWAVAQSGSMFIAVWCFFLVQAFFALIPRTVSRAEEVHEEAHASFSRAQRSAEAALRRLSLNTRRSSS